MSRVRPRVVRWFAVALLASVALGIAPTGATCTGPVCHDRDPRTDHDGREPESHTCPGLR